MNILVTGATGFLGSQLVRLLLTRGYKVHVLSRHSPRAQAQFKDLEPKTKSPQIKFYQWPQGGQNFDPRLVQTIDVVIHLAGENVAHRRWRTRQKKKIFNSRILTTRQLVQNLNTPRLKTFICASAIGAYASHPSHIYTENDQLACANKGPAKNGVQKPPQIKNIEGLQESDFLAHVVQAWEAELQPLNCRKVMLRTGLVLGRTGGAFRQLKTLSRLHLNGPIGKGRMWVSWVHEHDWLQAVLWLLQKNQLKGAFNLTSPLPVQQIELARAVAVTLNNTPNTAGSGTADSGAAGLSTVCGAADAVRQLYRSIGLLQLPAPEWGLRLVLGERAQLVLASQRVQPYKLQQSGFKFQYPRLEGALVSLISA